MGHALPDEVIHLHTDYAIACVKSISLLPHQIAIWLTKTPVGVQCEYFRLRADYIQGQPTQTKLLRYPLSKRGIIHQNLSQAFTLNSLIPFLAKKSESSATRDSKSTCVSPHTICTPTLRSYTTSDSKPLETRRPPTLKRL